MKDTRPIIAAMLSLFAIYAMAEEAVTFTPNELKWKTTAAYPGREQADLVGDLKKDGLYVTRVKLPPHYKLQAHSHPDDRTYTILSGTWYVGWGEKYDETKLIPLPAGSFYIEHSKRPHFVATKEDGALIQITGRGPSGQDFVDPADGPKM